MGTYANGVYVPALGETGWGDEVNAWLTTQGGEHINVMDAPYGCVGDGVTDDTTGIQTGITAARSAGIPLYFPPGKTFLISAQKDITGITIYGYGATVKHKGGVTNFLPFVATDAFNVYGLTVDMNKTNVTDPADPSVGHHNAFYLIAGAGWTGTVRLKDLTIKNAWGAGMRLGASSGVTDADSAPDRRVMVSGCTFTNCDYGIYGYSLTDSHIENNTFADMVITAVWDYLSLRVTVASNTVDTCGDHGIVTQYSRGFVANNNSVYACGNAGICVGGGDVSLSPADKFAISGNVIRACTNFGIDVDTSKLGSPTVTQNVYGSITGNVCDGSTTYHGIYGENTGYLTVTGNTCRGNADTGILINGYRCVVVGNLCTANVTKQMAIVGTGGTKGEMVVNSNSLTGGTRYLNNAAGLSGTMLAGGDGTAVHASLPAASDYAVGSQYFCSGHKQPLWSDGTSWYEADGTTH